MDYSLSFHSFTWLNIEGVQLRDKTDKSTVKRGTASSLNTRVHSFVWLIQERYVTYALCDVNHPAFVTEQRFLATCLWPCEATGSEQGRERKSDTTGCPLCFPLFVLPWVTHSSY